MAVLSNETPHPVRTVKGERGKTRVGTGLRGIGGSED